MKVTPILFSGMLATSLALPAFANDAAVATPLPQFTAADTQMLFEQDAKPMQFAALSQQEMQETEGAWASFVVGGFAGGLYNGISYYNTSNRTVGGWSVAIGSGVVGGAVGGIRWWSAPIWGGGIAATGNWASTR